MLKRKEGAITPRGQLRLFFAATLVVSSAASYAQNRCSATGVMGGEKFVATHCVAAFLADQNSVTLWFNESPISPQEVEDFQVSAHASSTKDAKERTMLLLAFCPGGGKPVSSAASVRSIDMGLNHARSAMAGAQWVIEAPKDFKVDRISGDIKPGGKLAGRITGSRSSDARPYSWDITFDVTLPAKEAAAGVACGN